MSVTATVSKQKAFILMSGFHSLRDKLVLGVCMLLFGEVFYKTRKSVCIRKEVVNGLKTV